MEDKTKQEELRLLLERYRAANIGLPVGASGGDTVRQIEEFINKQVLEAVAKTKGEQAEKRHNSETK